MTVIQGIPIVTEPPKIQVKLPEQSNKIADIQHPEYRSKIDDWKLWRSTYTAGQDFIDCYLKKFSRRESNFVFNIRKEITPIPAFAKAAINDIKNAIYQRTADITRAGGPTTYQSACTGLNGGVDLATGTMNWFIGNKIIPELLTMSKVGVFIDAPPLLGPTVADKGNSHPYLYTYHAEDIRSWNLLPNGDFSSILLRNHKPIIDPVTKTPKGIAVQYKLLYLTDNNKVAWQIYNSDSQLIGNGTLNISKIPFIIFQINDSLLSDVARHQIALLNLESSDVSYALLSNVPFYIEQIDPISRTSHLKIPECNNPDCTDPDCQYHNHSGTEIEIGASHGRQYTKGLNAPAFINPSTDPLKASMAKQEALKNDIRLLVNLSLSNIQPQQASAESKQMDQSGLESGLSYIGLALEHGERKIATFWSLYEGTNEVATISYPKRYSLKSDKDRQDEAVQLAKQLRVIPSKLYQQLILKQIVETLIGDKISDTDLNTIFKQIDSAECLISDSVDLIPLIEQGILSKVLAAKALFLPDNQVPLAEQEHIKRLKEIAISQTAGAAAALQNPADRGLRSVDPSSTANQ
jgi:hypothetical protein